MKEKRQKDSSPLCPPTLQPRQESLRNREHTSGRNRGITSQFFQRLTTVTVEGSTLEVRRSQNRLRDMTLKKQECHESELVNGLDMFHDWNMLIYFTSRLKLGVTLI
ncbi:hypothetical protein K1719_047168 [Acacia pycnantha]|nr:hypothetical protein K1719_047168 [Acacia pycnantha]